MPEGEGVVLAFDYGTRFMGMALGECKSRLVRPLSSIECRTRELRWHAVADVVQNWAPQQLLVGLSLTAEGGEQHTTRQCRNFARDLMRHTQLPVTLIDERFTSLEADRQLREQGTARHQRRLQEHAVAAALLIEDYFNLSHEAQERLETLNPPMRHDPCSIHN